MNIREEILGRAGTNPTISDSIVFSTVIKAFSHDYMIIGEDAIDVYTDVFGESTRPLFEALLDEPHQLVEFAGRYDGSMLLEASDEDIGSFYLTELSPVQMKALGVGKKPVVSDNGNDTPSAALLAKRNFGKAMVADGGFDSSTSSHAEPSIKIEPATVPSSAPAAKAAAVTKAVASKGWIAKIWDKIKQSGLGVKEFFKKNPDMLKTLGVVGGVGVGSLAIAKIAKMMKNRKAEKQQLQTKQI